MSEMGEREWLRTFCKQRTNKQCVCVCVCVRERERERERERGELPQSFSRREQIGFRV
jgi:hypothetical protein